MLADLTIDLTVGFMLQAVQAVIDNIAIMQQQLPARFGSLMGTLLEGFRNHLKETPSDQILAMPVGLLDVPALSAAAVAEDPGCLKVSCP